MKLKYTLALLAALALPHFVIGEEDDKPVKWEDVPAPVAKAIKAAAGEAKLETVVLGDEDGVPAYETTWMTGGHKHEIAVAKDGTVLGLEEIITLAEAPEAIRAAISKEAGNNKVGEVEKVIAKGKTTFEATIEKGKGKLVVTLDEEGKVLEREDSESEKAEKAEKGEKGEKDEHGEHGGKADKNK